MKDVNQKIRIGYPKLRLALPVLIAEKFNYFKAQKLNNIEIVAYENAEVMVSALMKSEIEFAGFSALPIVLKAIKKSKLELIFIGGLFENKKSKLSFLITDINSTIKKVKDLEEKKIGIFPTKAYSLWIKQILKKSKINTDNVTICKIKPQNQIASLEEGKIDALFTNDPIATTIISTGKGKEIKSKKALVPIATSMSNFYFGSFNTSKKFRDDHPKIVQRVAMAIDKAIEHIDNKPSDSDIVLAEKLPEIFKSININNFQKLNFKKTNSISENDLKEIVQYYYHNGLISYGYKNKGLQFHYKETFTDKILYAKNYTKNILIKNWVPILSSFIAIFVAYKSDVSSKKNLLFAKEQYNQEFLLRMKSIPAQFLLTYENVNETYEQAQLSNIGKSSLLNIKATWEFYFIDNNDNIYQSSILPELIKTDTILFKKLINSNLINDYSGLTGFFGENTPFERDKLSSLNNETDNRVIKGNKILLDIYNSPIVNGFRISKVLNSQFFVRWRIDYSEEISNEKKVAYKYIWFVNDSIKSPEMRKDLTAVIGGDRIIKLIEEYEKNSKKTIFKEESPVDNKVYKSLGNK